MESLHLTLIVIAALVCITAIEIYALSQGIDGVYLSAVIAVFAAIVGAVAKKISEKK